MESIKLHLRWQSINFQASKNFDRLPNFAYSVPLAHYLLFCENGKVEEKEIADAMV